MRPLGNRSVGDKSGFTLLHSVWLPANINLTWYTAVDMHQLLPEHSKIVPAWKNYLSCHQTVCIHFTVQTNKKSVQISLLTTRTNTPPSTCINSQHWIWQFITAQPTTHNHLSLQCMNGTLWTWMDFIPNGTLRPTNNCTKPGIINSILPGII